jgi:uncharacterized protein (TIGR03435 family)
MGAHTIARVLALLTLFATATTVLAQTPPRFEVASVRPSPATDTPTAALGLRITSSQVRIASLLMKDYLAIAFNVSPKQIVGPDWIDEARFDVNATIPAGVSRDEFPAMLQELLRERFQMKVHREQREFPVYALTIARNGRKLTPSTLPESDPAAAIEVGGSGSNAGVTIDLGGGSSFALADLAITATHITLSSFADMLTRFVDRTVIDATGVTGRYDITAKLTREEYDATLLRSAVNAGIRLPPQVTRMLDQGPGNPVGPALEAAGLAFDSRRAPLDVIVIDSIQRTPTEN